MNRTKFVTAARKATATFLFSSLGVVITAPLLDVDVATWKLAVGTGVGALANLVYRWAERNKD